MSDPKRKEYDAIEALNYSTLKLIRTSAAYAIHHYYNDELGDKKSYQSGRAIHCAVLEPDAFESRYVIQPKFSGTGSVAARKLWIEDQTGEIISSADHDMALRSAVAVAANSDASKLMSGAEFEKTITWKASGIKCKGRLDICRDRITDIKYTRQNTLELMQKDFEKYDYHAQLAWYHDGAVKAGLITGKIAPSIIAVHATKESTFVDVAVLHMTDGTLEYGRHNYSRMLNKYISCTDTNIWPGMSSNPIQWELSDWKQMKEISDE